MSGLDTVWVLLATFMVFFMHAGFAMLEAGFTRAKNAVNIIMKNVLGLSTGTLAYWAVGYAIMFGAGSAFMGWDNFFLMGLPEVAGSGNIPSFVFFLFQAVFAATAATIVSGAVAERTKFGAYILFSVILTGVIYPIVGHWIWSDGWLAAMNFSDFAGSTVVHSVGGWAALAAIIVIGPRLGRFSKEVDQGKFTAHSIPLAALGTLILWFGWFGFNAGSELAAEGASAVNIGLIALNTQLAASAGAVVAVFLGWWYSKTVRPGFALNGALGGLVGITAPCAAVVPWVAVIIGAVGGAVMIFGEKLLVKFKIDDAIGAVPVHLGAGMWGTLSVGLFAVDDGLFYGGGWTQVGVQLLGILAVGAFVFVSAYVVLKVIDAAIGMRASKVEEEEGLDMKHGEVAYPDFIR